DPLQMTQSVDVDLQVIRAINAYISQLHDGFVPTQSHMSRTLWRFLDRTILPSEHIEAKVMEFLRKGILTKRQTINGQGQELVTTELNPAHPLVQEALPGYRRPVDVGEVDLPHDTVVGLPDDEELDGEFEVDETYVASDEEYDDAEEFEEEEGDDAFEPEEEEDNRGNLITPLEPARPRRTRASTGVR
ncbi:MAG TPA: hypothetical protein VFF24_13405, partial [Acidimicrobiia bacterium]|nr:hypothetical protein [Acidimicrobiia bacterium]